MPTQEELKIDNANSLSNQRANRSRRSDERALKSAEKASLKGVTSTKERREIKGYYEEQRGKIIDVSVNPPQSQNQDGENSDISQDGVDSSVEHGGSGGGGGGSTFNGSVLICINGSPYWIDIPYDDETGPYDGTGDANHPITAP